MRKPLFAIPAESEIVQNEDNTPPLADTLERQFRLNQYEDDDDQRRIHRRGSKNNEENKKEGPKVLAYNSKTSEINNPIRKVEEGATTGWYLQDGVKIVNEQSSLRKL